MDGEQGSSGAAPPPDGWGARIAAAARAYLTDKTPSFLKPHVERLPAILAVVLALGIAGAFYRDSIENGWLYVTDRSAYENKKTATAGDIKGLNEKVDRLTGVLEAERAAKGAPPLDPEARKRRDEAARTIVTEQGAPAKALDAGKIDDVITALEREARDHTSNAADRWRRIGDLVLGANTAKALAAYEEAFKLQPEDFRTCIQLARLRHEAGNLKGALAAAEAGREPPARIVKYRWPTTTWATFCWWLATSRPPRPASSRDWRWPNASPPPIPPARKDNATLPSAMSGLAWWL